jgi:uncharacterized protein (TIGR00375 family)
MKFIADFHVHSKFSRATAKNLDLENIYIAAQLKGITVVGTGDFSHPEWFAEIKDKLIPAEAGLFKLRDEISSICDQQVPLSCRGVVRFLLVTEISNIYKKGGKTRKNHNLVFIPDIDLAEKFNFRLDKIGNIKSDGRPILGLDARDLFEIVLEISDQAFLVPAHIWTPWFSLLGSKSGFDSVEECFADLTQYIFAAETGLSSDPGMNWRVSGLDHLTLISNSDAHSPLKLGREANLFNTNLSYSAIKKAMKTGDPKQFLGTFEFYPEQGKYHLDGHRKCNVRLWPNNTKKHNGNCPVCQKPLTLGVLYRVEELADRMEEEQPLKKHPYYNLIPLQDILSDILKVGPGSKKVMKHYNDLIQKLGPELRLLHDLKIERIERVGVPLLAEAVGRMRRNEIDLSPGYDGEFGKVRIFNTKERERLLAQKSLFVLPASSSTTQYKKERYAKQQKRITTAPDLAVVSKEKKNLKTKQRSEGSKIIEPEKHPREILNREQRRAVEHTGKALIIVAGPGTGKTRTLTHRIVFLITERGVLPENILAVTFTNKAAQEMKDRIKVLLGDSVRLPFIGTFHSLCFKLLNEYRKNGFTIIDNDDRKALLRDAIRSVKKNGIRVSDTPETLLQRIISAKQQIRRADERYDDVSGLDDPQFSDVYRSYQNLLSIQSCWDYEDLIFKTVRLFENDKHFSSAYRKIYKFVFVDEYQDINQGQYRIIRALTPPGETAWNLFAIGDPDQSIYGFRGSDVKYFHNFITDYPEAKVVTLTRNYRSSQTILDASYQVVNVQEDNAHRLRIYSQSHGAKTISILETTSEKAEAVAVGKTIEQLIGGLGFHSLDFGSVKNQNQTAQRSFSDFAVLYRTAAQCNAFTEAFSRAGIPHQIVSRENLFSQAPVAELISLLKTVEGFGSYVDIEKIIHVAKPGIGRETLEIFKDWSYKNGFRTSVAMHNAKRFPIPGMSKARQIRLSNFLGHLLALKEDVKGMTVEEKLVFLSKRTRRPEDIDSKPKTRDAFKHLVQIARTFGVNTSDFLATMALQSDTDAYVQNAEHVALMTMHAAKGLEFPVVFITGCENGLLPFQRPDTDTGNVDEERRLFYVAMTRAKEQLYLTYAKKRRIYGKVEARALSPFADEIEKRLRTHETPIPRKKKKGGSAQLKLF